MSAAQAVSVCAPDPGPGVLTILDGGMGHLLKEWGVSLPGFPIEQQFLAGVVANETQPEIVQRAHGAYIGAGARCITTNNFVATRYSLAKLGRQGDVAALVTAAARNAAEARQASGTEDEVLIAGSLPPLKESYQTEGLDCYEDMVQQYREIADALAPHVDLFLAETLSTSTEARAAAEATAGLGKPLWLSFSLEDSTAVRLRSREPLLEAIGQVQHHASNHLRALLLNCCAPGAVEAALPELGSLAGSAIQLGVYANGFKTTTTEWLRPGDPGPQVQVNHADYDPATGVITPAAYARHAAQWQQRGASIIGGCCGVGPEHIRAIAELLQSSATT